MSDSVTPWTAARQAPPTMGFSKQEYWSGLPCPHPGHLSDPGMEPDLPHCRRILYHLSHQGSPRVLERVAMPSSRASFRPDMEPGLPHGRRILYRLEDAEPRASPLTQRVRSQVFTLDLSLLSTQQPGGALLHPKPSSGSLTPQRLPTLPTEAWAPKPFTTPSSPAQVTLSPLALPQAPEAAPSS